MTKPPTKVFTMQVPEAELSDWRARAKATKLSVAELVRLAMKQPEADLAIKDAEIASLHLALTTAKAARPAKPVDLDALDKLDLAALEKQWRAKWEREKPVVVGSVAVDPKPVPAPKPLTDADREYRRKLLTGAFNPTKARKAKP